MILDWLDGIRRAPEPPQDTEADRLRTHMLAAMSLIDRTLALPPGQRTQAVLTDALLEVRHRLTRGMPES